jgi:sugar phosphate isomerase/epimerase
MLAVHNFRLAYENWCWATHAPTWADVYKIVQLVDRPNVGLCLDTFQTAGSEWADPTTSSGLIEGIPKAELESKFKSSLVQLTRTIPKEKIYLLQISDAYKPVQPFKNEVAKDGSRPRALWSHDYRPYPFNGGYLPVVEVAKAVLGTGSRCWFSMEVFDGGRDGKGKGYDLDEFAKGAMESHKKLLDACADE